MEARFGVEMGAAATKLNREQASDLVLQLLDKYESRIDTAPTGSTYQECYDVTSGRPGDAYLRLCEEVKEELDGMGIPLA